MLRHYGTPFPIDLLAGGTSPTATLTPGAAQSLTFSPASLSPVVKGDSWPCARGIWVKATTTYDQAASGGAAANWDELFRQFESFSTIVPKLGTIHDPTVYKGPVAKHIIEFRANGGRYGGDWARAQLVAADGDVAITLYVYLPFTNENFEAPEGFWPWVGWLANLNLQINVAASTALGAVSTGAVIKTAITFQAAIDAYVLPQPPRFIYSQWNAYQSTAATGNTSARLDNVGQAHGLAGLIEGCRIAEVLEVCSPLGLGGVSTGDLFTSFKSAELGQETATKNPDIFTLAYRNSLLGGGPRNSNGANASHDGSGNPNTLAATPNGSVGNVAQLYVPWRFSSRNQRIENCPKWGESKDGNRNIFLDRDFTTAPSAGMHLFILNEIRDLDANKRKELERDAGLTGRPWTLLGRAGLRAGQQAYQPGVYVTRPA